jgi:hypothetical protein
VLATGALIVGLILAVVACGGEPTSGPTLPTVDFTPKLVLTVAEGRVTATGGPRADDRVRTDPPTVPSGAVIEIVNRGQEDHRLQAAGLFDTGIMRPGERTTAVVTNTTDADKTVDLTDPSDQAVKGTITVLAGTGTG